MNRKTGYVIYAARMGGFFSAFFSCVAFDAAHGGVVDNPARGILRAGFIKILAQYVPGRDVVNPDERDQIRKPAGEIPQ